MESVISLSQPRTNRMVSDVAMRQQDNTSGGCARKPIMILGCTRDAGTSFLVTALCRHFSNRGLRVAPFKAQNISNNPAVTSEGLEIGRTQHLQAIAARIAPQVRMNPVLLKPGSDAFSQIIVMGEVDPEINSLPWMERKNRLWPVVREALHSLLIEVDQLVIEGADCSAETGLPADDSLNMMVALECQADVYFVADIDKGGDFAHFLGTWLLFKPEERALIKGFVLNKFQGSDPSLLRDASKRLQDRTGVPVVAVIPMIRHTLPEEDTLHHRTSLSPDSINIALISYPYASNLDEFDPLAHEDDVNIIPIREFTALGNYHAIILPDSKNTRESLRHLVETGLAAEILGAAGNGIPIIGICGGMQLLGNRILDPHHLESGDAIGLGLLDVITTLSPEKIAHHHREVRWPEGGIVHGYEMHHCRTQRGLQVDVHLDEGLGWQQDNVWGVYLHGLFENTAYRQFFLEKLGWQGHLKDWDTRLDLEIEGVSRLIESSGWSRRWIEATGTS